LNKRQRHQTPELSVEVGRDPTANIHPESAVVPRGQERVYGNRVRRTPKREWDHPLTGDRLRAERQARGLTLRDLAVRLDVSPSMISQIETGRSRPSVNTLYALANELGVSLDQLLFADSESPESGHESEGGNGTGAAAAADRHRASAGPVQRSHDRKRIRLASGVHWERLTTASDPETEFLYVTYEVGGASSPEDAFQRHGGREWGYVLSGKLGLTVGFDDYELEPGDSVSLDSTLPHRLYNRGATPVHAIWFVAGRSSLERPGAASTAPSD
jgi:transcriptional regulator with XRE-family HTH domain